MKRFIAGRAEPVKRFIAGRAEPVKRFIAGRAEPVKRFIAGAAVLAIGAAGAEAAALALDEKDVGLALAAGERSTTTDAPFDAEWVVTNASGEAAVVVTPFYRLALAARQAAFKGEPVSPGERARILREQKDRLPMWVRLKGNREDFARHYAPRFIVNGPGGDVEIQPSFVQNERTALREGSGFVARSVYGFPTTGITGTSRGTLVVRDAEGREVSRFSIDLARMR
jgi:hypothetical protein